MASEHDSWLEGLGVTGFSSGDDSSSNATDSIVGGVGSIASGLRDIRDSYDKAKDALNSAGNDLQDAKRATEKEVIDRAKSGVYYAVGDDDDAQKSRNDADNDANRRSNSIDKAGEDLDSARKSVVSDDDVQDFKDRHSIEGNAGVDARGVANAGEASAAVDASDDDD